MKYALIAKNPKNRSVPGPPLASHTIWASFTEAIPFSAKVNMASLCSLCRGGGWVKSAVARQVGCGA